MIGIIIPAYQAGRTIAAIVRECQRYTGPHGVIVVDDGSHDKTAEGAMSSGAIVRSHAENRGKGAALLTGFAEASRRGWTAAITVDADGQHEPRHIREFKARYETGDADIIIGARRRNRRMPVQRRMSNALSSAIVSRLSGTRITDSQSGYRLITRDVWETIELTRTRYDMESEMLVKAGRAGFKIREIAIDTVYRDETSHFHPIRDTWRMAKLFIGLWRET